MRLVASQDGKHVLMGLPSGELRLFHLMTKETQALPGPRGLAGMVAHHSSALVAGVDGSLVHWNLASGKSRFLLTAQTSSARIVPVFALDGSAGALCGARLLVWDASGARRLEAKAHSDPRCLAAHPAAGGFATGGAEGTIKLWSGSGNVIRALQAKGAVTALAYSPDGSLLVSAHDDRMVRVWDPKLGSLVHAISRFTSPVERLLFRQDGRLLLCCTNSQAPKAFSPRSGVAQYELAGHQGPVLSAQESPAGGFWLSVGADASIRLWNAENGSPVATHAGVAACFLAGGDAVAVSSAPEALRVYRGSVLQQEFAWMGAPHETASVPVAASAPAAASAPGGSRPTGKTSSPVKTMRCHTGFGRSLVRASQSHVYTAELYGLSAFDLGTGQRGKWSAVRHSVRRVLATPTDTTALVLSRMGAHVIDPLRGASLKRFPSKTLGGFLSAAYHPTLPLLALGAWDGSISLWDPEHARILWTIRAGTQPINDLVFVQEGAQLASAGSDGLVKLWDTKTVALVRELRGHEEKVLRLCYHRESETLLSYGLDPFAFLWDAKTGSLRRQFTEPGDWIRAAALSPTGRYAALGSEDRSVYLYDLSTGGGPRVIVHQDTVQSVEFFPDGSGLISGDVAGDVRCTDTASGQTLRRVQAPLPLLSAHFLHRRGQLLTVAESTLTLWSY